MNTAEQYKEEFLKAYDLCSDGLFKYALYKTSSREQALDLTQDAFTKVWEYCAKGKEVKNLKAFLYRTLNNLIIDYYRKRKSESLDAMMEDGYDRGYDQREEINQKLMGESLWEHVDSLEEKYKEVITLRYMSDLTIKEISEILSESENNISVKIHRGLEKIKEKVK